MFVVRPSKLIVLGAVFAAAVCASAVAVASRAGTSAQCGVERWAVKTLSDPAAGSVNYKPVQTTVSALTAQPTPPISGTTPRQSGVETTTYELVVRLVAAKIEVDRDIHLVIADPRSGTTMIAEFPDTTCPGANVSAHSSEMAAARAAFISSKGMPSTTSFTPLSGTATLDGVGFFDELHGQSGVAPNGIELHPVLRFSTESPPPVTTPTTVSTTPAPPPAPRIASAIFTEARKGKRSFSERITARICDASGGRLVAEVRERRLRSKILATTVATRFIDVIAGCGTHALSRTVSPPNHGAGTYVVSLRVRHSGEPWSRLVSHRFRRTS